MALVDVEITLRVADGEEMTDERLEALAEMGFEEDAIARAGKGKLKVSVSLDARGWEAAAESLAEDLMEEMADADVIDISPAE